MAEVTLDVIEEVTRRPIAHFEQLEGGICKPRISCTQGTLLHLWSNMSRPVNLKLLSTSSSSSLCWRTRRSFLFPKCSKTGLRSGLMPGEFVTKEYINGQNLGDAGESLSRQEAVAVYSQIGTMLSSFHQISAFSHFGGGLAYKDGEVRAKSREGIDTSHTAREYELQRGLKIVKASFQTPFAKWGSRLEGWVRKGIEVFSEDVQPCLTHGDFSATNIMVFGRHRNGTAGLRGGWAGVRDSGYF